MPWWEQWYVVIPACLRCGDWVLASLEAAISNTWTSWNVAK
jgi:hypothetical protein